MCQLCKNEDFRGGKIGCRLTLLFEVGLISGMSVVREEGICCQAFQLV